MKSSKQQILMVFPETPYPHRASGISVRYLPVIQHLGRRHSVDIIIISLSDTDEKYADALGELCRRVDIVQSPNGKKPSVLRRLIAKCSMLLPWTPPITFTLYGGRSLARELRQVTQGIMYDSVVWVTGTYSAYLGSVRGKRIILDFIDSPSVCIDRGVTGWIQPVWLRRYERWKMRQWEKRVSERVAATIYVSPIDALHVNRRPRAALKTYMLRSGVNLEQYATAAEDGLTSPSIGFLGNMGYLPNSEAVQWLYEKVFLPVRAIVPELTLYIIGREPTRCVRALGLCPGVVVTGTVDSIWKYINGVNVFVIPLLRGAGVKNKILEAMYAKKPVITSAIGAEGIGAQAGRELIICNTAEEFFQETLSLLRSPERRACLGEAAHKYVSENFCWEKILNTFEAIITGCGEILDSPGELSRGASGYAD